ncbi:protein disulfide-isomerase A3-like [Onthophagus taurus]|uniref:protein disulfide-isomerase A3-like n=1 Tax=Onthophagus taurus TaxID=166361 RepID=UPI0039BDBC8C
MIIFLFLLLPTYHFRIILGEDIQSAVIYTDETFHEKISESPTTLVMFYAPWCGHCKQLKPQYEKAAQELSTHDPAIVLAKVDCTSDGEIICKELSIGGFPTLKLYKFGTFIEDYDGRRNVEDLVLYMKSKSVERKIHLFEDVKNLDDFLNKYNESGYVIGFFEKESLLEPIFLNASEELWSKILFGYTTSQEAFNKYKINNEAILFIRSKRARNKFEQDRIFYEGNPNYVDLKDFIIKNNHGLVGHRVKINRDDFKPPYVISYFDLDYKDNAQFTKYWRNRILKVAKNFTDKLTFAMSSIIDFKSELKQYYGLKKLSTTKPIVIGRDKLNRKYIMENEFSITNLEIFANNLINDDLTPYVKSEPVPSTRYDNYVLPAVGTNFQKLISETTKDNDVFVVLYKSKCSEGVNAFHKVGLKLENEQVEIIKMDYDKNDITGDVFEVVGCLTVYWVPKGDENNPILYEGGRRVKELLDFVAENASEKLKTDPTAKVEL